MFSCQALVPGRMAELSDSCAAHSRASAAGRDKNGNSWRGPAQLPDFLFTSLGTLELSAAERLAPMSLKRVRPASETETEDRYGMPAGQTTGAFSDSWPLLGPQPIQPYLVRTVACLRSAVIEVSVYAGSLWV